MGLAASQARFLGITARKNHCELKSMQIAQEKLSVTNQLSQISEDYQRSLDATKLVWDSEVITDGSIYDVSYELLMHPSQLNDYSPQLLTNHRNQIVLNNEMANGLREMGILGTKTVDGKTVDITMNDFKTGGFARTNANFERFLKGMNASGVISTYDYNNMINHLKASPETYMADSGCGGEHVDNFAVEEMNIATLKKYINTITDDNSKYMNDLRQKHGTATNSIYDKVKKIADLLNFKTATFQDATIEDVKDPTFGKWVANRGDWNEGPSGKTAELSENVTINNSSFNFADLLTRDVIVSSTTSTPTTRDNDIRTVLEKFIPMMYDIMKNFFAIDPNSCDKTYLDFAMTQTCDMLGLKWNSTTNSLDTPSNFPKYISTGESATKHTGIILNGDSLQVSLTNIAKNMLTYFEVAVEGYNSGYTVESADNMSTLDSYYVTQDPNYMYFIDNPAALDEDDSETLLLIDYYSQMFNQICTNGWTENAIVDDPEMLKNMLKNGTLFTSTLADDGMFYQGAYTSNNFIAEVADEDAIARAEADFKIKQAKLNALEERLNVDMQMVDAELSALTTEYDTVKQMISKGIEKGFSTLGGG